MIDWNDLLKHVIVPLLTGGVITLFLTRYFERRNQKRDLYAKAYQAVLSWQEILYRVRRRADGLEAEQKLIEYFHNIQEQLNYYQGMMSAESKTLGKSYRKFAEKVKEENEQLIQQAWESKIRRPEDGTPKGEVHPDINKHGDEFLYDTRLWLKWWQIPRIYVWWRNR